MHIIYKADPQVYPQCDGRFRTIGFIFGMDVLRNIPKNPDLWDDKQRLVSTANSPPAAELE